MKKIRKKEPEPGLCSQCFKNNWHKVGEDKYTCNNCGTKRIVYKDADNDD